MLKVDIDKFVRGALRRNAPPYNGEEMWRGIEERLDAMEQPVPAASVRWLWPVMALAISLAGGTGYYIGRLNAPTQSVSAISSPAHQSSAKNIGLWQSGASTYKDANISNIASGSGITANTVHTPPSAGAVSYNSNPAHGKLAINGFKPAHASNNIHSGHSYSHPATAETVNNTINTKARIIAPAIFFAGIENTPSQRAMLLELPQHETSLDIAAKAGEGIGGNSNLAGILYNFNDNPAYTGNEAKYNFNTRAHLYSFDALNNAGADYMAAFDARINKTNSGIGIYATRNITSSTALNSLGLTYSYKMSLGKEGFVRLGVGGSISNSLEYYSAHYDSRQGTFGNYNFTPQGTSLDISSKYFGAHAGIWMEYAHFTAGVSIKDFNSPVNGEYGIVLPISTFNIGYNATAGQNFKLLPMAELMRTNGLNYNKFSLLTSYKDGIIGGISIQNGNPVLPGKSIGFYLGANLKKHLLVFSGYGANIDHHQNSGVGYNYIQAGIKYQVW